MRIFSFLLLGFISAGVTAGDNWTVIGAIGFSEAHADTMRHCKLYAKYQIEDQFKYCEQAAEQNPRAKDLVDWLAAEQANIPSAAMREILYNMNKAASDLQYLREVGVF